MKIQEVEFSAIASLARRARKEVAAKHVAGARWFVHPDCDGFCGTLVIGKTLRLRCDWIAHESRGMGFYRDMIADRIEIARASGCTKVDVFTLHPLVYDRRGWVRIRSNTAGAWHMVKELT